MADSVATAGNDLWGDPDIRISYLGVCGEYNTGKTLAVLDIRPERTCYFGFEDSACTYAKQAQVKRVVEAHEELGKLKPKGYDPIDIWKWWEQSALALPPGEFDVIAVDDVGGLEAGLYDYILSQYAKYEFSSRDAFAKAKGLPWGHAKRHLEYVLQQVLQRSGAQTIAFTCHMTQEWKNGVPTSRRVEVGKDTWKKLATLFIELQRPAKQRKDGSVAPVEIPLGIVRKGRLARLKKNDDGTPVKDEWGDPQWVTVNPPVFPQFTPGKIRYYIANPPDYTKLKKGETIQPVTMTAEQELEIRNEIAANERAAAELKLQAEQTKAGGLAQAAQMLAEKKKADVKLQTITTTETTTNEAESIRPIDAVKPVVTAAAKETTAAAQTAAAETTVKPQPIPQELQENILGSLKHLGCTKAQAVELIQRFGAGKAVRLSELSVEQLVALNSHLNMAIAGTPDSLLPAKN